MRETLKIGTLKWQNILKPDDEDLKYLKTLITFTHLTLKIVEA